MAVFASANDAVAAAIGAQGAIELPVRMGLHAGEAQVRDGEAFVAESATDLTELAV